MSPHGGTNFSLLIDTAFLRCWTMELASKFQGSPGTNRRAGSIVTGVRQHDRLRG